MKGHEYLWCPQCKVFVFFYNDKCLECGFSHINPNRRRRVMAKCIICGEKQATVRDRNEPWSRRKKLCVDCHVNRLKNDFIDILEIEKKRRLSGDQGV